MDTLATFILYTAAAATFAAIYVFLVSRFYQVDLTPDQLLFTQAEDGWRLALRRYRPATLREGAPPVLLCAGPGFSASIFDVSEDMSLARYLRDQGHDVWVLDLRGRGFSEPPRLWGRRRPRWTLDDYVDFDLPAAISEVVRQTGLERVHWVGLGFGGLLPLAADPALAADHLASLVGLASAAFFKHPRVLQGSLRRWAFQHLWTRTSVRLLAPLLGRATPFPFHALVNPDNMDGLLLRRALVNAVVRFSSNELDQVARWMDQDRLDSKDGRRDFRERLAGFPAPTLLVGGAADALTPPAMLEATLTSLNAAPERVLLLAGREQGLTADYGQLDLLLGQNARRDLFPRLHTWLDDHGAKPDDTPQTPAPDSNASSVS